MLRPARADDAPALSDLAVRSKGLWGYDDAFLERARPELTVTAGAVRVGERVSKSTGRALPLLELRLG